MRRLFQLSRPNGRSAQLEREFRAVYQEPGLRNLKRGALLGVLGFGGFLLLETIRGSQPALAWATEGRLLVVGVFALSTLVCYLDPQWVVRRYTTIFNALALLSMIAAAAVPVAVHGAGQDPALFFWSLDSSLATAVIGIYGLSRLTARNTAAIVISGCFVGAVTVGLATPVDWYFIGRLAFHLTLLNVVAYSLRQTVESRERQLFMLAEENLTRNRYAEQLELAKARAEEADALKLRFLQNMSHEFRTPMNGVIQALHVAEQTAKGTVSPLIGRAIESGNSLLATLEGILDYSRWTQEGLVSSPMRTRLSALIGEVAARHRARLDQAGVGLRVRLDLAESTDVVLVDGLMLSVVVDRLLDNARKFTLKGGVEVSVELKRRTMSSTEAWLALAVADTGVGIDSSQFESIFAPFHQIDAASSRRFGGAGLGLAIVKRLVSAMGGAIQLRSGLGVGSKFSFEIPVEISDAANLERAAFGTGDAPSHTAIGSRVVGASVLLVEDNDLNADLAEQLLSSMGVRVTRAHGGLEAVGLAVENSFQAILMDCQMPETDGYEATRAIREAETAGGRRPIPIIAVTANALAEDRQRCLNAGMNDYLAKPYSVSQLRRKLLMWLQPSTEPTALRASSSAL